MKTETEHNKNSSKPIPQIRVRSNVRSGINFDLSPSTVNPRVTDLASPTDSIVLVSNDGSQGSFINEARFHPGGLIE